MAGFLLRCVSEAIPDKTSTPRGNSMSTHSFVDASHGSDRVTRRSQSGILIFCNRAPIIWYSKRQNTVETRTFGTLVVSSKRSRDAVELACGNRKRLHLCACVILDTRHINDVFPPMFSTASSEMCGGSVDESHDSLALSHFSRSLHFSFTFLSALE